MKFAYEQEDGTVAIAIPAPKKQLERVMGPMTDENYETFVRSRLIPDHIPNADVIVLPDDWQGLDRSKRDEWRIRNGEIVVL